MLTEGNDRYTGLLLYGELKCSVNRTWIDTQGHTISLQLIINFLPPNVFPFQVRYAKVHFQKIVYRQIVELKMKIKLIVSAADRISQRILYIFPGSIFKHYFNPDEPFSNALLQSTEGELLKSAVFIGLVVIAVFLAFSLVYYCGSRRDKYNTKRRGLCNERSRGQDRRDRRENGWVVERPATEGWGEGIYINHGFASEH